MVIGTRLADDLGLTGNSFANIPKMTRKSVMQLALKEAGLRSIQGREVGSVEDCLAFFEEAGTEDLVLKHVHGVASVGVHLVHGRQELLEAFRKEETAENMFGEADNCLLVQERILGEEYIVNTVSKDGVPALTSVLHYNKKRMPSGAIIYRGIETITEPNDTETELVQYAFKAVRALGITDGPVHGEYMIDDKGPVLIEANCRVMGSSMPTGFLDKVFGHHETDVVLDSMLDREFYRDFSRRPYRPLGKGYVKYFYSASERAITSSGVVPILLHMKSFYSGWVENAGMTDRLQETTDLETETGCVYLIHDEAELVKKEFDLLMSIEEKYPNLLQSDAPLFLPPEDASELTPEIRRVLAADTETLINDILSYYENGAEGTPPVPEELLNANAYNREIMDLLKTIAIENASVSSVKD